MWKEVPMIPYSIVGGKYSDIYAVTGRVISISREKFGVIPFSF